MLDLRKPLAIFDLETTGVNLSTDRIVEIAVVKLLPDGKREVFERRINPEMPIPAAATAVHGISDEDVKGQPTFKQIAHELIQFIDKADLGGYNSNRFDIPVLMEELLRAGKTLDMKGRQLIDVQRIFHTMEQRTLAAAMKFYCNRELENAHSALADADATLDILLKQVERYPQLGNTIESVYKIAGEDNLVDFARRLVIENGVVVFNFGKYKGQSVADVLKREPQYYDWMMKGDFPLHTKQKLTEILNQTLLRKS
jgi:DNA polymerase-3 subunit epsilon